MTEEKNINEEEVKKEEAKAEETKVEETKEETVVEVPAAEKELKPGMTIRVYQKIKEINLKGEEKERVQYFEGMIIAKKHGKEIGSTITVRKISDGVAVEKIFPLNLPTIDKIVIKKEAKVNRSKLYFLRGIFKRKLKETIVK